MFMTAGPDGLDLETDAEKLKLIKRFKKECDEAFNQQLYFEAHNFLGKARKIATQLSSVDLKTIILGRNKILQVAAFAMCYVGNFSALEKIFRDNFADEAQICAFIKSCKGPNNCTLLMVASKPPFNIEQEHDIGDADDYIKIIKFLIKNTAATPNRIFDAKRDEPTPIHRVTLEQHRNQQGILLLQATRESKLQTVKDILRNANGEDIVEFINIQGEDGHTPLMLAIESGHEEIVETLLVSKASTLPKNHAGESAYQMAVSAGSLAPAKLESLKLANELQQSLKRDLITAVKNRDLELLTSTLEKNINVNCIYIYTHEIYPDEDKEEDDDDVNLDTGIPLLNFAIDSFFDALEEPDDDAKDTLKNFIAIVKILLKHYIDLNLKDKSNQTALKRLEDNLQLSKPLKRIENVECASELLQLQQTLIQAQAKIKYQPVFWCIAQRRRGGDPLLVHEKVRQIADGHVERGSRFLPQNAAFATLAETQEYLDCEARKNLRAGGRRYFFVYQMNKSPAEFTEVLQQPGKTDPIKITPHMVYERTTSDKGDARLEENTGMLMKLNVR